MQDTGSESCPLLSENGTFRENPDGWDGKKASSGFHGSFTGEGEEEETFANSQKELQILFLQNKVQVAPLFLLFSIGT